MKSLKLLVFLFIQLCICLLIVESVCYLFLIKTSNPLYRARRILNYDSSVGWFQKPFLDTKFDGSSVVTDANGFRISKNSITNSTGRVLTLGPSSAFGWGVENNETYSSIIAKKFHSTLTNVSGIGHSMLQGEIIWNKFFSNKNSDIHYALISYGINDLDKYRFFDSEPIDDKEFLKNAPLALTIDKLNLNSNFAMALSLMMREIEYKNNCSQLSHSVQRVPWVDFKSSLDKIIIDMKKKNILPVIVGTAYYLKHSNPDYSSEKAIFSYKEVNRLAQNGHCKEAYEYLKIAKSYEPDHINEKVMKLNTDLKKYAASIGIVFIDSYQLLNSAAPGENYFDPVHPSVSGHRKIAAEILRSIINK